MSKELIEQLRELSASRKPYATGAHGQIIGMESYRIVANGFALECIDEAADRIEELERKVASRDAEVAKLKDDNEYLYVAAIERDQLREELEITIANRDRVEETHSLTLREVQAESMRLQTENDQLREQVKMLRDALEVTHELYANASSGYGFARPENPHNFHCDIDCCSKEEIEAHSKACDDYAAGRKVSNDSWGIGTYCDEYAPAIKALAATEPKP